MKRLLNQFKTEYFGNISVQLIGTGIAQTIPFLVSPILTRLYPESGFATYTFFMAVVAVLVVPNGGRYFYAMVIPKEEAEAADLARLSFWLTLAYNAVLLLVVLLFYNTLNEFYQLDELWYAIPLYVAFFGIYNVFLYLSVRKKYFKNNAVTKVVQTASTALFSILFSFFGLLFSGLALGKIVGVISSIPVFKAKPSLRLDLPKLKRVAKKYIDYPKVTIVPSLLDIFSVQALVFFVGRYYSEESLGYLGLTNMILIAPLALIGVSFRDVFYQKIASFFNDRAYEKARKLFLGSAAVLLFIGTFIALILLFFGETIFAFVYGDNWITSGKFAVILGFAFCAKLFASPLSSIFNATHQLRLLSIWQTTYFFTTLTTLYFAIVYYKLPITDTLLVYTIHEVILYIWYFFMQKQALNKFKLVKQ